MTSSSSTTAVDLARVLGPLRRALLRATREAGDLPDLSEAQVEVLRLLIASGPMSSAAVAAELGLARPTISNLLKAMRAAGLVERAPTAEDLRSAPVTCSDHSVGLLARYDDVSARVVNEALAQLEPSERRFLHEAVGPLEALTSALGHR